MVYLKKEVYHGEVRGGRVSTRAQLDYASALVRAKDKVSSEKTGKQFKS
jgi:hypothetical protein